MKLAGQFTTFMISEILCSVQYLVTEHVYSLCPFEEDLQNKSTHMLRHVASSTLDKSRISLPAAVDTLDFMS